MVEFAGIVPFTFIVAPALTVNEEQPSAPVAESVSTPPVTLVGPVKLLELFMVRVLVPDLVRPPRPVIPPVPFRL